MASKGRPVGLIKCHKCRTFHVGRCQCEACSTTQRPVLSYERPLGGPLALCEACASHPGGPDHQGLPRDCPSCLNLGTIEATQYGKRPQDKRLQCPCGLVAYWSEK